MTCHARSVGTDARVIRVYDWRHGQRRGQVQQRCDRVWTIERW